MNDLESYLQICVVDMILRAVNNNKYRFLLYEIYE
jgi:hypothetical protein